METLSYTHAAFLCCSSVVLSQYCLLRPVSLIICMHVFASFCSVQTRLFSLLFASSFFCSCSLYLFQVFRVWWYTSGPYPSVSCFTFPFVSVPVSDFVTDFNARTYLSGFDESDNLLYSRLIFLSYYFLSFFSLSHDYDLKISYPGASESDLDGVPTATGLLEHATSVQ